MQLWAFGRYANGAAERCWPDVDRGGLGAAVSLQWIQLPTASIVVWRRALGSLRLLAIRLAIDPQYMRDEHCSKPAHCRGNARVFDIRGDRAQSEWIWRLAICRNSSLRCIYRNAKANSKHSAIEDVRTNPDFGGNCIVLVFLNIKSRAVPFGNAERFRGVRDVIGYGPAFRQRDIRAHTGSRAVQVKRPLCRVRLILDPEVEIKTMGPITLMAGRQAQYQQ